MEEAFEGIQGFPVIVDDIIISGTTIEEHYANVRSALIRARGKGVKLNLQKCVFKCNSMLYFGHVISENRIHPDPQKVRALHEMWTAYTRDELHTILRRMNCLARYIPNLSSINQPLSALVKQQQFKWEQQHDTSFTNIKESICSSLAFFDQTAGNVELQVNTLKFDLGATLSQNGKPISFASCSLNSTKQNYLQIEKELYAILFGCVHFHQYLYGQKFTVGSDHKPLQVVLNCPISKSSPRLQRMLLRIQQYNLIIAFCLGKEIPIADALSWLSLPEEDKKMGKEIESYSHSITSLLTISNSRLKRLKQKAKPYHPPLAELAQSIQKCWPSCRRKLFAMPTPFWNICHARSIDQNSKKKPLMPCSMHHLPWEKVGCNLFYKKENTTSFLLTISVAFLKSTNWGEMQIHLT